MRRASRRAAARLLPTGAPQAALVVSALVGLAGLAPTSAAGAALASPVAAGGGAPTPVGAPAAIPAARTAPIPAAPAGAPTAPAAPTAAGAGLPPAAPGPTAASLARHPTPLAPPRTTSAAGRRPATATLAPNPGRAAPDVTTPPPGPVVRLAGHGAGGGVGLGQYGAYGYATVQHATWQWMIGHYYTGAYLEPVAAAVGHQTVDVDLTELDGAGVTLVRAAPGATVAIDRKTVRPTTVRVGHPAGQTVEVTASSGDLQVDLPGVGWRSYQGTIQVQPDGHTWNVLPLEDYVSGVVPAESIASWGAAVGGEAALQAQAVAARSYALASIAARGWICDTPLCQNYLGDPAGQDLGSTLPYVLTAVSSTAGQVVCTTDTDPCPLGAVAVAQYGASTGGWTQAVAATGETFSAVPDSGDAVAANPFHTWGAGDGCPTVIPAATVGADFGIGVVVGAKVTARNGHGVYGGRALEVELIGRQGGATETITVSGDQFAATLGLCSDWFAFY
ncbi:MAG: SpoIID/LytB domain-containing protein [Acidimicrobiales bacterium]